MRASFALGIALAVLAAACGRPGPPPTREATTTSAASSAGGATAVRPTGFPTTTIVLDGVALEVYVADTPSRRRRGLMGVTDLDGRAGMLFVFPADTQGGFWMKHTRITLDIAFFDAAGRFVDGFVMSPCRGDPCPVFVPDGPYRTALESPVGSLDEVGPGSVLVVGG